MAIGDNLPATAAAQALQLAAEEAIGALLTALLAKVTADPATATAQASTIAKLAAILTALGTPLQAGGAVTVSNLLAVQPISATALPLPSGAATDAGLQAIALAIGNERVESLWVDDSGGYFVRIDQGGAISWTTPAGATSSGPGVGARPAAGANVLLSRSGYQATAAGAGYAVGDYLDHLVTIDPSSGAVLGNFWVNVSTGAKLAASPAAANVTPVSARPTGAATDALQTAGNLSLASIVAALAGTLTMALPAGAASAAKQDVAATTLASILAALGGTLKTSPLAGAYTQNSVVLTANQAAGTDPLLPANAARRALQFAAVNAAGAATDFKIALVAGAAAGMPVYGSARDDFTGALCPAGIIYLVSGSLAAGNTVVIWEAQ